MAASTTASVVEAATTTKATAMTTRCLVGPTRGKCCCERRYPLCSIRSREEENFGHLLARFPAVCVCEKKKTTLPKLFGSTSLRCVGTIQYTPYHVVMRKKN